MKFYIAEESLQRLGPITLTATVYGGTHRGHTLLPAVYDAPGLAAYIRELPPGAGELPGELEIRFSLDKALPPDDSDPRERGIIVASIDCE